jgi:hypothetical protein
MKTTDKILFVDDDESVLAAHRRALKVILPASGWAPPVVESAKGPTVTVKR